MLKTLAPLKWIQIPLKSIQNPFELGSRTSLERDSEKVSKIDCKANRPIIGENAFSHKAGLHIKAVLKDPSTYEAISPEKLNRKREFIIDKYTGRAAIKNRLSELGIDLDEKNQLLKTNLWLEYYWFDDKVQWKPEQYGGIKDIRIPSKNYGIQTFCCTIQPQNLVRAIQSISL